MSNTAANYDALSDAEIADRAAMLKRLGVRPKPSAEVVDHPARRRPLGLAILDDDGPGPSEERDSARRGGPYKGLLAGVDAETRAASASVGYTLQHNDLITEMVLDAHNESVDAVNAMHDAIKRKFDGIEAARRAEAAELRATIAELRSELSQMRSIQEAARVASRGEQGIAGPRGIPGPPGSEGRIGPQGPAGRDAAMVAAWEPNGERFTITPVFTDGTRGPPLILRPLFEQYDAATADEDG
jgi:hypothetical protein